MSIITLQFGQCGNQIGQSLFSTLYEDLSCNKLKVLKNTDTNYINESVNRWFNINKQGLWEPRSILVDTECKVAYTTQSTPFKFTNVVAKAFGGSANNWAYGYTSRSNFLLGEVMECVRREVERCDYLSSFLNIFSSSGGTGSGVGNKITETLRDEFYNKDIVNAVVFPYESGEVVTQNYNTVLTLGKLYENTDMIILFSNDRIHYMCNKLLSLTNVSFEDINSIISQQLAALLQPAPDLYVSNLIANLVSHPSYKLVEIKSAPHILNEHKLFENVPTWPMLINSIIKSNRFDYRKSTHKDRRKLKNLGSVLITRGGVSPESEEIKLLLDQYVYVPWLPVQSQMVHSHQNNEFLDTGRFVTYTCNTNNIYTSLNTIVENAWNLFTYSAYLHHYKKFGIDEEYFLNSFQQLETVLHDYNNL